MAQIDEDKFSENVSKHEDLIYSDRQFAIVLPNHSADIKIEASELKHCVASYIPRVIDGSTMIVFCRDKVDLEAPLVTVEVKRGYLTQAYGYEDSKPSEDVLKFLRKWANKKEIKLAWRWD